MGGTFRCFAGTGNDAMQAGKRNVDLRALILNRARYSPPASG